MMKLRVLFTTLFFAHHLAALELTPCWSNRVSQFTLAAHDVPYQKGSDPQKLDIYIPTAAIAPYKTVVLIHGGCFQWGSKSAKDDAVYLERLTGAGYAVISLNYRLAEPRNPDKGKRNLFPASMEDVQDAIRWLRVNGAKYDLQTDKLLAFGFSAGATLASYLGTRLIRGSKLHYDDKAPDDPQLSKSVNGVIDFFGRTDFLHSRSGELHDENGRDCGEEYLGESRDANDIKDFEKASVLNIMDAVAANFLIVHGTKDALVSIEHSELLHAKLLLLASGSDVEKRDHYRLFKIDGADHMFPRPPDMDQAWSHVCPFLTEVLGSPRVRQATK